MVATSSIQELSGHAGSLPGQGPFFKVHLCVVGESIAECYCYSIACPKAQLCGDMLAATVVHRRLVDARGLTFEQYRAKVGPLPRDKRAYPKLAFEALQRAIAGL